MMTNWDNYRRGTTPQQIQDNDVDVMALARKQREKLKKKQEQDNYFKRR